MGHPPTTEDERPRRAADRPADRRLTLAHLLGLITMVPVCVGVVAAVESAAADLAFEWFGVAWRGEARRF